MSTLPQQLIDFIQQSPTPFHAANTMVQTLVANGFTEIREEDSWDFAPGGRYVLSKNDSSVLAFVYGKNELVSSGMRMIGAHTDSPCLKAKPNADIYSQGYWQVGVEVYGGVLLNPWFDRELGMAGRVAARDKAGKIHHLLVNFDHPVGMVPSLAIHLDREANKNRSINAQKDLPVLMSVDTEKKQNLKALLLAELQAKNPDLGIASILDYEVSFYDVNPGQVFGLNGDFIAAARLDNLLSCFAGMQSIIEADGEQTSLLVCNDHEEVGSCSAAGAQGPMLQHFLQRLLPAQEDLSRCLSQSMMISADNAHGIHPNFAEKHDARHGPKLNAGPVIKINANQRYASNSETQSIYRAICEDNDIPVQAFVVRSDMACGSTIGPITATEIGVKTLDIGVPTFGMHSIRETAGVEDLSWLIKSLTGFLQSPVS